MILLTANLTALVGCRVLVASGGVADLSSLQTWTDDSVVTGTFDGFDPDLSSLRTLSNVNLVLTDASPDLSSLTNITSSAFDLAGDSQVQLPSITSYRIDSGYGLNWYVDGTNALLSPAHLTSMASTGNGFMLVNAQAGGRIELSAPITVEPGPLLALKYFWQRDVLGDAPFTDDVVEPSVPFSLAVLVNNPGLGLPAGSRSGRG